MGVGLAFFAACHPTPPSTGSGGAARALQAVDSLMWQQPDSALALLLRRDVACNVSENPNDSLEDVARRASTTYDRHYAQLLMAELLYKNDYAQANRPALLQAVAYFDSLAGTCDADTRGETDTRGVSLQTEPHRDARRASAHDATPTTAFLAARAHYINGVGYYEQESAIQACTEYIRTKQQNHF